MAPISIKFDVLNACLKSSILFGCEIWGSSRLESLDACHRKAIRFALSVRQTMNNEITYIESGLFPLTCDVKARQLKFWMSLNECLPEDSYLKRLINLAITKKISYVMYYKKLETEYNCSKNCSKLLQEKFKLRWSMKIMEELGDDPDSRLGTYKLINPQLKPCDIKNIPEFERIIISRFRTGSHKLHIEKGRNPYIRRELRICVCGNNVQTLHHVLFQCALTKRIPDICDLNDFFNLDSATIIYYIRELKKTLSIRD